MEELVQLIEKWAADKGISIPDNVGNQSLKLIEEYVEFTEAKTMSEKRNELGDVMVVLVILCKQLGFDFDAIYHDAITSPRNKVGVHTYNILLNIYTLRLLAAISKKNYKQAESCVCKILESLDYNAFEINSSLENCLSIAYNKIKNRKGKTVNGIFVKEA